MIHVIATLAGAENLGIGPEILQDIVPRRTLCVMLCLPTLDPNDV